MVSTGANIAFCRVQHFLTLYLACCQTKQKPLGAAGKSVFDVRVAETQATGLLLFDMARVYAKESFDVALWEFGGIRENKKGVGIVPLAFKQGPLESPSCTVGSLHQVNSYKCRCARLQFIFCGAEELI